MTDALYSLVLAWIASYLLHSSFLIGLAYLADRYGMLKNIRLAELVWRIALFGGLVTSSMQMLATSQVKPWTHTAPQQMMTENVRITSAKTTAEGLAAMPTPMAEAFTEPTTLPESGELTTAGKPALQIEDSTPIPAQSVPAAPAQIITLPAFVRDFSPYLIAAWLLVALLGCLHTLIAALRLNRLAKTFPLAYQTDVTHLFQRFRTLDPNKIKLRISDQWNSPLVTPDGSICLPTWTYSQLTRDQFDAMLSHELSHVARRDPAWRLATQILSRICFFQALQWIAIRKLSVLAELACDQNAAKSSGKPHDLAQALYICAKAFQAKEAPSLALAMSRGSSPLLIRIESLLDETQNRESSPANTGFANVGKFSLIATALVGTAYAMPPVIVQLESLPGIESISQKVDSLLSISSTATAPQAAQQASPKENITALTEADLRQQAPVGELPTAQANLVETAVDGFGTQHDEAFPEEPSASTLTAKPTLASTVAEDPSPSRATPVVPQSAEAQAALGEALWKNKGDETSLKTAEDLFRKAAAGGNTKAQKYMELFAEREKQQAKIAYYLRGFDGSEFKSMESKCERPAFAEAQISAQTIEFMIGKMEYFASCFNQYSESLRVSSAEDKLVPPEVLRLMSADEAQRAIAHTKGVHAMLRVKAKITAEEFNDDKRNWESKTKAYFNGSKFRDWSSIKRLSFVQSGDAEKKQAQDPQIVNMGSEKQIDSKQ